MGRRPRVGHRASKDGGEGRGVGGHPSRRRAKERGFLRMRLEVLRRGLSSTRKTRRASPAGGFRAKQFTLAKTTMLHWTSQPTFILVFAQMVRIACDRPGMQRVPVAMRGHGNAICARATFLSVRPR